MGSVLSVPAKQGSHSDGIEGLEGKAAMIAFIFSMPLPVQYILWLSKGREEGTESV